MWNDKEKKDIQSVVEHLSEVLKITSGITLSADLNKGIVILLNESKSPIKEINIADNSPYGVLEDIMSQVLTNG